jgi:hypothetical protein
MKKLLFATAFTFAAFTATAAAAEWKGTISEAGCGAKHADASEASQACVRRCVEKGAAPVFVVDDKVLKIDAASVAKVKPHLGHKVTITGKLEGDTVTIETIKM